MKSYILTFLVASLTYFTEASEFGDISVFLPFLRTYESLPSCPPNEVYKMCTGKCSDCTQRGMCIVTDCMQGCDCAPYFYRVTPDGPCEPVANCPRPDCGENEVFRECGPVCERCTTLKCRAINCYHKCYCKEGYLRNKEGTCIPAEECPIRHHCSASEEWADSGLKNEFCLTEINDKVNETQNVSQCYCKEGHKRNVFGYCIKESLCPLIRCPGVEVFHDCIPKCNTTCRNYGNPNCTVDGNCYPGCFCPQGCVMNDFRTCIPVENCSLDTPQVKIVESSPTVEEDESSDSKIATQSPVEENTDATHTTDEYQGNGKVPEENATDETLAVTKYSSDKSDTETTENPVSTSLSKAKPLKIKTGKNRDLNGPSKHANAAAVSEVSKQEMFKDEDDFDNGDI